MPVRTLLAFTLLTSVLCLSAPGPATDAGTIPLSAVRKIYIDKMDHRLDQYLRAEFAKQLKGRIEIVLDPKEADAILTGVSDVEKGAGAKITGHYLGLHNVAIGTVSLVDREREVILWSDEAGDRSRVFSAMKHGGERKVADRLVAKLKKVLANK